MEYIKLGNVLNAPRIVVGCMRISDLEDKVVDELISTAMETGANFFDHADIYGGGESETVFAKSMVRLNR